MDERRVSEIEDRIAELKKRWPKHSVPMQMWMELEELETELSEVRGRETGEKHAGEDSPRRLP